MQKFFLTGPNRTGTTLLARCIDDHPKCICLFETNVHVRMFGGFATVSHGSRMRKLGFEKPQTIELLEQADGFLDWYDKCAEILKERLQKPELTHIGDKNPFFYTNYQACREMASCPKIWTIRDPRSVWFSKKPGQFFYGYLDSVRYFLRHANDTSLIIRFEDLLTQPEETMEQVYEFIGVTYNESFLNRSKKRYDGRFKWNPDATSSFDLSKIDTWKAQPKLPKKFYTALVKDIMERFGYK